MICILFSFDMTLVTLLFGLFRRFFAPRLELLAENLALRQQLAVLNCSAKRPKFRFLDRLFWSILPKLWKNWPSALLIVKPETVIKWHREGFRLYWRWKSKARPPGRPKLSPEIRKLIRGMSQENPLWGAPRIQAELNLLGFHVVLSEERLRRILKDYFRYYHESRPHESLERNSPHPRVIESGQKGPIISIPEVGGLHHRYQRAA